MKQTSYKPDDRLGSVFCRAPDLIVEVAHPSITTEYGELFLDVADYMVCLLNVTLIIMNLFYKTYSSCEIKCEKLL